MNSVSIIILCVCSYAAHVAAASLGSGARAGYRASPAPELSYSPAVSDYTAPTASPASIGYVGQATPSDMERMTPVEQCWSETKRCCYKEVQDGYECQDDYATKQAQCHPKMTYKLECDKSKREGKPKKKPENRVEYSHTETVHYDDRYGAHVKGYPAGGESKTYFTEELPTKPYGVTAEPFTYVAPTATSYVAPETAGSGYEGAPAPASAPAYMPKGGTGYSGSAAPAPGVRGY